MNPAARTVRPRVKRCAGWRGRMRDDEGSILPLTIFYGVLSLVLILLVVAATSLYIERKRLFTLADGAALVGAEAFPLDAVAPTASGYRPTLERRMSLPRSRHTLPRLRTTASNPSASTAPKPWTGAAPPCRSPRTGGRRSSRCSFPRVPHRRHRGGALGVPLSCERLVHRA